MAENGEGFSSQRTDLHYPERVIRQARKGKNSSYVRSSKAVGVDERVSSRLSSRGLDRFRRSGTRPAQSSRSTKPARSSSSSSSSSSPPNCSLPLKAPQVRVSMDLQNGMRCLSGSSDDSGSDLDTEVAEQTNASVPAETETEDVGCSSATGFIAVPSEILHEGLRPVVRRSRTNQGQLHGSSLSDAKRAHIVTSGAFTLDQDRLRGCTSLKASQNSLLTSSSSDRQCIDVLESPSIRDKKGKCSTGRLCHSDVQISGAGGVQFLASGSTGGPSRPLGQLTGSANGTPSRRKNVSQGTANCRLRTVDRQVTGSRGSSSDASASRAGSSRRNLSNLSCSSSVDVLPPVSSSSTAGAPYCLRHKKVVGFHGLNNGVVLKGTQSGKNQVARGSGSSSELNFHGGYIQSESQTPINLSPDTRSLRRPVSWELNSMAPSMPLTITGGLSSMSSGRHRESSSTALRFRNSPGPLTSSNEHLPDSAAAFGEEGSSRFTPTSTHISSRANAHTRPSVGPTESETLNRSRVDTLPSSSATQVPELQYLPFSLSGPPPTRPPPLPPFGSTLQQRLSGSQIAVSTPFTLNPRLPHGPRSTGLASSYDHDRQAAIDTDVTAYDPFHGFQLQSVGENRSRLTVEGLSEILSALEHVERDEDLSYQQILMLEATILFGGIGLHDRHRDMRLDVDNMSYEELLALEDRIGKVSTGLGEETILKCVRRARYVSLETTIDYVPQDTEIKCSICQEEFEDNVELGVLDCGHSHHVDCIKQWLRQKNQCPICKASAFA